MIAAIYTNQSTHVWVSPPAVAVVVYGGDDAPRRRRRKQKQEVANFYRELEGTIHRLLHPAETDASERVREQAAPSDHGRGELQRKLDELLVLAQGQHAILQKAAFLKDQLDAHEAARMKQLEDEDDELLLLS